LDRHLFRIGALSGVYALGIVFLILYQFRSGYSFMPAVREVDAFIAQYYNGVFAYRPLARDLLLWINDTVFAGERFYLSRAILNSASLVAFNFAFIALLRRHGVSPGLCLIAVLVLDLLAGLSLSVRSNPYTLPTLFLIYAGVLAVENGRMAWVLAITAIAGFTHEISALIPAFAVLHAIFGPGRLRGRILWLGAICGLWVAIYVGLRLLIASDAPAGGLYHNLTISRNIEIHALVVVLLVVALFLGFLPAVVRERLRALGRTDLVVFAALAVPYGIYMFFVGLLAELRLFLPFFPALVLACLLVHVDGGAPRRRATA
jgi:hypothetical protein